MQNKTNLVMVMMIFGLLILLFMGTNYERHWSLYADQTLTLAYNGLLINSGQGQEYLDHPGFLTIHSLASLLKFANLIQFSTVSTIGDLNKNTNLLIGLQEISIVARAMALIVVATFLSIFYLSANQVFKNPLISFILTVSVFFMSAVTEHFIQLRTEFLSAILIFLSCQFFYYFLVNERKKLFYLFLAITFLFLTGLNKTQIYYYAPLYYFSVVILALQVKNNFPLFADNQFTVPSILALIINLSFFWTISLGFSSFINFFYILSFNGLLVFFCRIKSIKWQFILLFFNIFYIGIFCLIFIIVYYFYDKNTYYLFYNLLDPSQMLSLINVDINQVILAPNQNSTSGFLDKFLAPMNAVMASLEKLALLAISLLLILLNFKKFEKKDFQFLITNLIIFFIILSIHSLRNVPSYFIFTDILLVVNLVYSLYIVNRIWLSYVVVSSLCVTFAVINFPQLVHSLNRSDSYLMSFCNEDIGFITTWHQQINMSKFKVACNANNQ